jgi:hypothetical protein
MAYDPNEPLTLADQLRLLAQTMPEAEAKARLGKAFRLREITYRPLYAVSYEDAMIDYNTGKVFLRKPVKKTFTPTVTAAEFVAHFPQAASALARRIDETTELLASEIPSADRTLNEAGASGEPTTTPTASYLDVKAAIQKHGPATEKELSRAVSEALPNKHVSREWVRRARDELFGKKGRTGRPKSPK